MSNDFYFMYQELVNRLSDFERFFVDLKKESLPNGWGLVSGIEDVFSKRQLIFSKSLVDDKALLDLLLRYSSLGFNTEGGLNNYNDDGDGLFKSNGPTSLKEELEWGITLMNKPKYFNDDAVIDWNSLCHELLKGMHSIDSGYVRDKMATVWLTVPVDCPNFVEYLI